MYSCDEQSTWSDAVTVSDGRLEYSTSNLAVPDDQSEHTGNDLSCWMQFQWVANDQSTLVLPPVIW